MTTVVVDAFYMHAYAQLEVEMGAENTSSVGLSLDPGMGPG